MSDRIGQQLGNYRLIRFLGQGGFADVYLGEHVYLKTQAAVKVLHVRLTDEIKTFLDEARTIASLSHPHIVRVLDFGVDDSTPFLVMDYAANGTLRQRCPRGTRQPLLSILTYLKQVAMALQYAHDRRLIHRDVKPENMLLGLNNEILLSDFGIAVIAQSTRYGSTQEVAGTIAYMAPEQVQGRPQPASDQYALGVVVYELLSGDRPFHGSFAEIASQHMFVPPAPLHEKIPTIPSDVERAVMTALEKDPRLRFANVQAFADALDPTSRPATSSGYSSTFIRPLAPDTPNTTPAFTQPVEMRAIPSTAPTIPPAAPAHPPAARRISRRAVIAGLAGLAVAGGSIITWIHTQAGLVPSHGSGSSSAVATESSSKKSPGITPESTRAPASSPTSVANAPLPIIYHGHSDQVYTVAWSPDGKRIASGGYGDIIQLWDARTGNKYLAYSGHSAKVYSAAWSPSGTYIASGHYDATVQVWNASTGKLLFAYYGHPGTYQGGPNWINSVAWSPDGMRIASGSHDTTVQICDAVHGDRLLTYQGHSKFVNAVAWSPNGMFIASGSGDKTVQLWNATNGTPLLTYSGHTDVVVDVAWSPDGRHIVSGGVDKTVKVWDATDGSTLFTYSGHAKTVNAVGWSFDGQFIASGGDDTTVQIWNATNGSLLLTYGGHTDVVQALAWSPHSMLVASASDDKTVQICAAT